jgi:hypothetical protein
MEPKKFMLYYVALMAVAVLMFIRRRPRKGMRLRLRGGTSGGRAGGRDPSPEIDGGQPPDNVTQMPTTERPLNVIFNWNGETWDAYEVLGLPAGSSQEKVAAAYEESLSRVDEKSRGFITAAHDAIQSQWRLHKASRSS